MQKVAGIAVSVLSEDRNDSLGSIVSNLALLIQRANQMSRQINPTCAPAASVFRGMIRHRTVFSGACS
jgi:ABC-type transporter Mla subunit MlaD